MQCFRLTKKATNLVSMNGTIFLTCKVMFLHTTTFISFKSDLRSTAHRPDNRAQTSFAVKPPTLPILESSEGSKTQETEKQEREITSSCCEQAPCPQPPAQCSWDVTWGTTYHQHDVTCNTTIKHKSINWQEGTGITFLQLEKKQFGIVSKKQA